MDISKKTVHDIAYMARLSISDADVPVYQKGMQDILNLFEQVSQIDSQVPPMAHPLQTPQILRKDEQTIDEDPLAMRERLQANAKDHTSAGLFLVPQVIETIEPNE